MSSAEWLDRASTFSVLKYLPSVQTITDALAQRDRVVLTIRDRWEDLKEFMSKCVGFP
jgi:hypothetical protein